MTAEQLLALNPPKRTELVRGRLVYRADGTQETVEADGVLHGETVLPEFSLSLAELA